MQTLNPMEQQNTPNLPHSKSTNPKQKTHIKQTNFDIKHGIWLTEEQKIYIQHKLPKLYSLIPVPTNTRVALNSKLLEEEFIQFTRNKRGRPEGTCLRNITDSPTKSRKSMRISNRKQTLDLKQSDGSESEQSGRNEQLYSGSFAKQLQFSKSVQKLDVGGDLNESNKGDKPQQIQDKLNQDEKSVRADQVGVCDILSSINKSLQVNHKKVEKTERENKAAKPSIKETPSQTIITADKQQQIPPLQQAQRLAVQPVAENKSLAPQQPSKQILSTLIHQVQPPQEDQQAKIFDTLFASEVQILKKLKSHENILPFLQPVDQARDGAPEYYSIINDPIDIQTIEFKLNNNIYKEAEEFHLDIKKMWNNARTYNTNNKFMLRVTNSLEKYYSKLAKTPYSNHSKPNVQKAKKTKKILESGE